MAIVHSVRATNVLVVLLYVQQISGTIVNVPLDKPSVKSIYQSRHPGFAVDGFGDTCIHTGPGSVTAWWKVDLQTVVDDATVMIYFSMHYKKRSNAVQLYTSTKPFSSYPGGQLCHTLMGKSDGRGIPDVTSVVCPGRWRYLMVYTSTNNNSTYVFLDFCELEVFACSSGTYGANCDKSYSSRQCSVTPSPCARYTGLCPGLTCIAGYRGIDCATGTYGSDCSMSCIKRKCTGSAWCDHVTGECVGGCQHGWTLSDCTQTCPNGNYGPRCSSICGHCTGDDICDYVTENCPDECQPGWRGNQCKQIWHDSSYGDNCSGNCGHCNGTCDKVTGHWAGGCKDGYNGTWCELELNTGHSYEHARDFKVIPSVVGTVSGVLLIIVIIVVSVYRSRKMQSSMSTKPKQRLSSVTDKMSVLTDTASSLQEHATIMHERPFVTENASRLRPTMPQFEFEEEVIHEGEPTRSFDYRNGNVVVLREIPVNNLADIIEKINRMEGGFEAEYNRLPTGFLSAYDDSQKPENAGKNRYIGYYPYDYNRVRLSLLPDVPGSDYINASSMHSFNRKKRYIAAQATNKKTVGDFWRMIWEQHCGRVIMLTSLSEDIREKCCQYWLDDDDLNTGHFLVEVKVMDTRANFRIRNSNVTSAKSGECRSVDHYHFTYWPDHGVPATLVLVHFIWMIRQAETKTDGPLLVHCSAGIDRTGTYIAVDSLLDQARGEGVVDVLGYVSIMRGQRKNMIQTKEQYECVFHCLQEMTKFSNTSMDAENFIRSYSSRGMDSMVERKTLMELTKMLVAEDNSARDFPPQHGKLMDGFMEVPVRYTPSLTHLKGYLQVEVKSQVTEELLWKLVEENNVHNTVIISQLQVCINGGITTSSGCKVTMTTTDLTHTKNDNAVMEITFEEAGCFHNVNIFQFGGYTTLGYMSSCLLNHDHLQQLSVENTPVVIVHRYISHDHYCMSERKCASMLCIMRNVLSESIMDHHVVVIRHVRTYHKCCPDVTFSEKYVEDLHECIQMLASSRTFTNM